MCGAQLEPREILAGLTVSESDFFLMYQENSAPMELRLETRLFQQLMHPISLHAICSSAQGLTPARTKWNCLQR